MALLSRGLRQAQMLRTLQTSHSTACLTTSESDLLVMVQHRTTAYPDESKLASPTADDGHQSIRTAKDAEDTQVNRFRLP